jgi:predicted nucleic acid-binding protein
MLTCEAVVTEAFFLIGRVRSRLEGLWGMLESDAVRIAFSLAEEMERVQRLMRKYSDIPMSLADACLVRMSEHLSKHSVMTLDSDVCCFRRHRDRPVPVIMPENL